MSKDLVHKPNQRRLLALDQCLRKSGGITRAQIISSLKTQGYNASLSTFNRDIRFLRDQNAPVGNEYRRTFDGTAASHWFYNDPSWTLGQIHLTDGALFSLLIARRVMEQYRGLPVAKDLQQAYDEIAEALNRKISVHHDSLVPVSFSPEKPEPVDPKVWTEVIAATREHRLLGFQYRKAWEDGDPPTKTRNVRPYHIVNLQGTWYLLASAGMTNMEVRQYALSRIFEAQAQRQTFTMPRDFNIEKLLQTTFGQFIGDPDKVAEVVVRFSKRIAPLILSRQFSATETKKTLSDGGVELRFSASTAGPWPLYHVKSWVLSWGADAEVLAPAELCDLVRTEIRGLHAREEQKAHSR